MFTVKTPAEALAVIRGAFLPLGETERVPLAAAVGRIAAEDGLAGEYVPAFTRSTVDGYAVRAADTFGCSDSLPALLRPVGKIEMGEFPSFALEAGCCAAIPTGGALPDGADAAVMVEFCEIFGDDVGVLKPVAPGENLIYKGDDAEPGQVLYAKGRRLTPADIGSRAALGSPGTLAVVKKPVVGILSTGNELVPADQMPREGEIRDVNSDLLAALMTSFGAEPVCYGIVRDDEQALREALATALNECDAVLLSGGSSVGEKDHTAALIAERGEILFHGIALKPGKPTILGKVGNKPVFGLPGHPAAAYFVTRIFVREALCRLTGELLEERTPTAILDEPVGSNHGRAEFVPVTLYERDGKPYAHPLHSKSGLVAPLAKADGFCMIDADCEGLPAGSEIAVREV